MICFTICGIAFAIDFTLPAALALLLLLLPARDVSAILFACMLHETAHFLALFLYRRKPTQLRISGIGMRLSIPQTALCPLRQLAVILLSGAAANLFAATFFLIASRPYSAMTHLSLALFNLLPYRSTDGGTMLYALLEHFLMSRKPTEIRVIWRIFWISATILLAIACTILKLWSFSLAAMYLFLTISELLADF